MTLPWMQPGLQVSKILRLLVKVSGLQGKVAWQDLKDHMKQAGKVSQLQRAAFVEKMPTSWRAGSKIWWLKNTFFGKKYRKHIIYIYTESSSRVWNCFPEKPKKHAQKKRNRHFGAEIWHPNGSRYKNPLAAFIYLLNPEIWVLSRWLYPWRMVPPLRNGFIGGSKHPPAVRNYPVQNVCCMMFDFPTESVQGKV